MSQLNLIIAVFLCIFLQYGDSVKFERMSICGSCTLASASAAGWQKRSDFLIGSSPSIDPSSDWLLIIFSAARDKIISSLSFFTVAGKDGCEWVSYNRGCLECPARHVSPYRLALIQMRQLARINPSDRPHFYICIYPPYG